MFKSVGKSIIAGVVVLSGLSLLSCNKDDEIGKEGVDAPEEPATAQFEVIEYLPAPGQFINEKASGFNDVKTPEEACLYAQGRLEKCDYVSLGAFGGYIVVKSKESIRNSGGYDFSIGGNSYDTSNEPGIVWVMRDTNGNGLPDDEWYELKGSYYGGEGFQRNYSMTYFRPSVPEGDVLWRDSDGIEGEIKHLNSFHSQPYYPEWVEEDRYTLTGSRLPDRTIQNPETGVWSNLPYEWGYADNMGEESKLVTVNNRVVLKNYFRISDAVDEDGAPVSLDNIDFIKVQSAVNGFAGVIGEVSTEVCGFFTE